MIRPFSLALAFIVCSCGTDRSYVERMYGKMPNNELLRNRSAMNDLMAQMESTFGVSKTVRMQSAVIDAELQKRGITGRGLPPLAGPPPKGQSDDFGLRGEN